MSGLQPMLSTTYKLGRTPKWGPLLLGTLQQVARTQNESLLGNPVACYFLHPSDNIHTQDMGLGGPQSVCGFMGIAFGRRFLGFWF